jgi:hypothetical protein
LLLIDAQKLSVNPGDIALLGFTLTLQRSLLFRFSIAALALAAMMLNGGSAVAPTVTPDELLTGCFGKNPLNYYRPQSNDQIALAEIGLEGFKTALPTRVRSLALRFKSPQRHPERGLELRF